METINKDEIYQCFCNKEFDKKSFKNHYKTCNKFKNKFSKFDNQINLLLKEYSGDINELKMVIFLFERYIKLINKEIQTKEEKIKEIQEYIKDNYINLNDIKNEFYIKQLDKFLVRDKSYDEKKDEINDEKKDLLVPKIGNNFLINYFSGQTEGEDENPAGLPNFQKLSRNEYLERHDMFVKKQKKIFKQWRLDDKQLQNLKIIDLEKYYPLGFNLDLNFEEIFINQLKINNIHENKYMILKIISEIAIYNYIMFLGEDKNKEVIPISIFDADKYYSLCLDNWDKTGKFYNIGKYIIIMNPNYLIYKETMYDTKGIDGLICQSPNETILFNDEKDLKIFLDLLKKYNFESLKNLGDIMTKNKFYEKAIYYYEKTLEINKDNNLLIIAKIYSNLSENYIKYRYYTKGLFYINKSIDIIDDCIKQNKEKFDNNFLIKLHLRKIRCFIGLRLFKEAHDYLEKIKNDKRFKSFYKFEEAFIIELFNINEIKSLINIINIGYQNYLGIYNLEEMLNEEKTIFYLNYGDYINPKIEIGFDPLKGIKIIAKEDINRGEYVLVEKAIYCCRIHDPNNEFETNLKINTPLYQIHQIEYIDNINHLIECIKKSPLDYIEFFILYNGDNLIENYKERMENLPENLLSILNKELIEKIFKHNRYTTIRNFYYIYKVGIGIWRYLSLFNHSCIPNTSIIGIGDFVFVIANKLIKKGEEITILYLSNPKHYNTKTRYLKNEYNFECDCPICKEEKNNRKIHSDIIQQYDSYLNEIKNENDYKKSMKMINDFSLFLDKNKTVLTKYELGTAYLEIQCKQSDISYVKRFYSLANKYLENIDNESMRVNINKYFDYIQNLKDKNLINSDSYNEVFHEVKNFYESFCGIKEKELKLLLKDNLQQKQKDNIFVVPM